MRTISKATLAFGLAIGFVGAAAIGAPGQSLAQYYDSGPGVRVYVDPGYGPRYRRHRYYRHRYYGGPYAYSGRYNSWNGCPRYFTVQDGVCKPYRGY